MQESRTPQSEIYLPIRERVPHVFPFEMFAFCHLLSRLLRALIFQTVDDPYSFRLGEEGCGLREVVYGEEGEASYEHGENAFEYEYPTPTLISSHAVHFLFQNKLS